MADLEGPNLKIIRAKQHIHQLRMFVEAFRQTEPYVVARKDYPKTGKTRITAKVIGKVPEMIPLIFGDVVHNLRAALDIAWRELVESRIGLSPDQDIRFPFAWSKDVFESPKIQRPIEALGPDIVKFIGQLRPYKGGNDPLFDLHRLDIEDKHKAIVAAGARPTGSEAKTIFIERVEPGGSFTLGGPTVWTPAGEEIELAAYTKTTFAPGAHPEHNLKPVIEVTLNQVGSEPQPIVATAGQFSSLVKQIVELIAWLISNKPADPSH